MTPESIRTLEIGEIEPKTFKEKLQRQWRKDNFVCVGLDSDWSKIPGKFKSLGREEGTFQFNKEIIDSTADLVCAYKPNMAFYEDSEEGTRALERTVEYIHKKHPYVPVIGDAKKGDIDNTNIGYVKSLFQRYKFDAVTVHPYLGAEALRPFLDEKDKGIIVLAKTSNKGSGEFQGLHVSAEEVASNKEDFLELIRTTGKTMIPFNLAVAYRVSKYWNKNDNCCLVTGANYPGEIERIRKIAPNIPLLIPGIGAQNADIQKAVVSGMDKRTEGIIVNAARSIIFADREEIEIGENEPVGQAARRETRKLRESINFYRRNPEGFTESQKELARELYKLGVVKFGSFRLKLHDKNPNAPLSPYYFDNRLLRSASKETKLLVAKILLDMAKDLGYDVFADIPTGITPAVADLSMITGVPMITPREEKTHGSGVTIDGIYEKGKTVALTFDDVITSGQSANNGINTLRRGGVTVKDFVALMDREQGGVEAIKSNGCDVHTAYSTSRLLRFYLRDGIIDEETYDKCINYNA